MERVEALLAELESEDPGDDLPNRGTVQTPVSRELKANIPKAIGPFSIR